MILKHHEHTSFDSDLEQLLDTLSKQHTMTINCTQAAIEQSMREVVIYVGRELLKHRALLLPKIYTMLCKKAKDTVKLYNLDCTTDVTSIVSTRWVLSSITASLEGHVQYHCAVRKYGTVIYRQSSDLHTELSHALWSSHRSPHGETECLVNTPDDETKLLEALNTRVHAQVKAFTAKDDTEHSNFSIERLINEIDPVLWEAIAILTQSVSERRGTSAVLKEGSAESHIKRVRRLFLLCSLMFTVNDHCSSPMHVLVADILESQGSTALLHQILNRLGVCASADTLSRFVQSKAENSNWLTTTGGNIDSEPFTVVSADNIDFVHKHARIVGKSKTSWHGTTVQAVQSQPYRAKTLENAKNELFPERTTKNNSPESPFLSESKLESNIITIMKTVKNKSLLEIADKNRGLINPFSMKVAKAKQEHDLLHFREIGQAEFNDRIKNCILKTPSTQAPNRKRRLETFTVKHAKSKKITTRER